MTRTTRSYNFEWETYVVENAWIDFDGTEGFQSPNTYWSYGAIPGSTLGAIRCLNQSLSGIPSDNGTPGDFRCIYIPPVHPAATMVSVGVEWAVSAHTQLRTENRNANASGILLTDPQPVTVSLCMPLLLPTEHNPIRDWARGSSNPNVLPSAALGPYDGNADFQGSDSTSYLMRQIISGGGYFDGTDSNGIELSRFQTADPFIPLYPAVSFRRPERDFTSPNGRTDLRFKDWMWATGTCTLVIVFNI